MASLNAPQAETPKDSIIQFFLLISFDPSFLPVHGNRKNTRYQKKKNIWPIILRLRKFVFTVESKI